MARQGISTGTIPNDGTGDSLLDGAVKINENFDELYALLGDGTTLSVGVVTSLVAGTNISISTSYGSPTISVIGLSTGNIKATTVNVIGVSTFNGAIDANSTSNFQEDVTLQSNLILGDNDEIRLGALSGGDLLITHVSSTNNSLIRNKNTSGSFIIDTATGSPIEIRHSSGGEKMGVFTPNNSVSLYYDNSKKFETIGTGVTVTGTTFTNALTVSGLTSTTTLFSTNSATIDGLIISQDSLTQTGTGNIRIGDYSTLGASGNSNYNIAIGQQALDNINNGDNNIAIGYQAAQNVNASDSNYGNNTAIGYQAFKYLDGSSNNVAVGFQALQGPAAPGTYDTLQTVAIGANAGWSVRNTRFSSFFGYQSGYSQTSADYNTFLGYNSGSDVITGSSNVIIGGYTGNQDGFDIRYSDNNVVLSDGDGNIRVYADSSGNVGIGTTRPTSKLTVFGGAFSLRTSPGKNPLDISQLVNNTFLIRTSGPDPIAIAPGNTTRLTVNTSGISVNGTLTASGISTFQSDLSVGISTARGVILTSPNGTKYRLIVDDSGNLDTVAV